MLLEGCALKAKGMNFQLAGIVGEED